MGLSLHYELRLPATLTSHEVNERLEALRAHAIRLRFERVSTLLEAPLEDSTNDLERYLGVWAAVMALPLKEDKPPKRGDVATARGFVVFPGRGCEAAGFGFLRRATRKGTAPEWFWACSCKTQYASVVSDALFLACHTTLCALLDYARELGIGVRVDDEGYYWDTRDTTRLLAEVHRMNRLIAGFAGRLSDQLPNVQASIFEHPEFEHLEMESRDLH